MEPTSEIYGHPKKVGTPVPGLTVFPAREGQGPLRRFNKFWKEFAPLFLGSRRVILVGRGCHFARNRPDPDMAPVFARRSGAAGTLTNHLVSRYFFSCHAMD